MRRQFTRWKKIFARHLIKECYPKYGLPSWLKWARIHLQCGRLKFDPWVGKIPWGREQLPNPVFLPDEFHGQRSLVGHSPWGHKESDTTEWLTHTHPKYTKNSFFFFFFAAPGSMQDLSSPTRDWTCAPCIRVLESFLITGPLKHTKNS